MRTGTSPTQRPLATLLLGPARSGKTTRALDVYRQALLKGPIKSALWLAPNHKTATTVRRQLLNSRLRACLHPGVATFDTLAQQILDQRARRQIPLPKLAKKILIQQLARDLMDDGKLPFYGRIAHTQGWVNQVESWISELKRLEIWPEDFTQGIAARGPLEKDHELAALYEGYQHRLNKHGLYDAEGRFWAARTALKLGEVSLFTGLQLIVVDGFSDFTRTQYEMLEALGSHCPTLLITLPWQNDRRPLFARTEATRQKLKERFNLQEEQLPRSASQLRVPALAHLEQNLFEMRPAVLTGEPLRGLHILAASSESREIEVVCRRVKQLLQSGDPRHGIPPLPPNEVLVVSRNPATHRMLLREWFNRLGIPHAFESGDFFLEFPVIRALLSAVRLAVEDWSFSPLMALVRNNYFRPAWPEFDPQTTAPQLEACLIDLGLASGQRDMLRLSEWWQPSERPDHAAPAEPGEPFDDAELPPPRPNAFLTRLGQAMDLLPSRGSPQTWGVQLAVFARELGIYAPEIGPDDGALATLDRDRIDRFCKLLISVDQVPGLVGQDSAMIDRREILAFLRSVAGQESVQEPSDDAGRVRILKAVSCRNLSASAVFVLGLAEKSFPQSHRDGHVYADYEIESLHSAGLPVAHHRAMAEAEMLLFYELVTRAEQLLHLSYPALDPKGQPLLPTPYLTELERAFSPETLCVERDEDLSPLPKAAAPQCEADDRILATARALRGETQLWTGWGLPGAAAAKRNIVSLLRVVQERGQRAGFGPWEGLLADEAIQADLRARFGADYHWSTSALDDYAYCPFKFLVSKAMKIQPFEPPQLETNLGTRGTMFHEAAARVHQELLRKKASHSADEAEICRLFQTQLARAGRPAKSPLAKALQVVDRRVLYGWAESYAHAYKAYLNANSGDEVPTPRFLELDFGSARSEYPALQLPGDAGPIRIEGRIDRIDACNIDGQDVYTIIDYKTGAVPKKGDDLALARLQLVLYAMAVEALAVSGATAKPWQAGYWDVRDRGFLERVTMGEKTNAGVTATDEWTSLKVSAEHKIRSLVRGVHQGEFPVYCKDESCTSRCGYRTLCRVRQVRTLEKEWEPPCQPS